MKKILNSDVEKFIKISLIVLTFISIMITILNFTYLTYIDQNIDNISNFLINYINGPLLWIDNILLFVFAIIYIVCALKSKKETSLKISFSIIAILTSMIPLSLIINALANIFGIFN